MAASAGLGPDARRKLRRIDNGHPLLENGGLGQCHVVGGWTVAGLAADARFREGALLQIHPC